MNKCLKSTDYKLTKAAEYNCYQNTMPICSLNLLKKGIVKYYSNIVELINSRHQFLNYVMRIVSH